MRVIYKYLLYPGETEIQVPANSRILKIDTQDNDAFVWIEQDPSQLPINVKFKVFGTGIPFDNPDGFFYVDTFLLFNGGFVGHTYASFV